MELIDIVNQRDRVIGSVTRNEIYQKKFLHRIVHVLVFNRKNEMALQLRSKKVDFCPLHWSTAVGGHVMAGETYQQAANREMKEEIGLRIPIKKVGKYCYLDNSGLKKFLTVYKAFSEEGFVLENTLEKVEYFQIETINQMIAKKEKFHPELLFILKKCLNL